MFSNAIWLLGLVPWAVLAVWLFLRPHDVMAVPFLPLWLDTTSRLGHRRSAGLPPLPLICVLLAILMAILGAGGMRMQVSAKLPTSRPAGRATITLLSASDRPHAQVLLRINTINFNRPTIELNVASDGHDASQTVHVDANGVKNVFVDLPSFGSTVTASLDGTTAAIIHRQGHGISLAADAKAPAALRRLISLMRRPGDATSIGVDPALLSERTGIVLAPPTSSDTAQWTVVDDPLTRNVDWSELKGGCVVDPDWTPLVFHGKRVLIARRSRPAMQILASVATVDWPKMPSFVVFWKNAIDVLAGGSGEFEMWQQLPPAVTPSISSPVYRDLSPFCYLTALSFLLIAAMFVPKRAIPYTAGHVEFLK